MLSPFVSEEEDEQGGIKAADVLVIYGVHRHGDHEAEQDVLPLLHEEKVKPLQTVR